MRSIMVFFCIDWTLPIRSWDQYNIGFNPTCQTGYSTCESDLSLHHPAPWCVVYPRVPSLVPYFTSVLWRPAADHWEPRTLPAPICWWLTDLRLLSSINIPGATITHLYVHRSCRWVDAFKSSPTRCGKHGDPLISYKSSTSPTATSSAPSRYWLRDAVCFSPRPRNSSWFRHVDEFPRQEDHVNMFRCAEAASFHSEAASGKGATNLMTMSTKI